MKETSAKTLRDGEQRKVSPATVNRELRYVKAALRLAVDWGFTKRVPRMRFLKLQQKLPTFANCHELHAEFQQAGITATVFPQRVTNNGDGSAVNCWNPLADDVEAAGLPVVRTVCGRCEYQSRCHQSGYLAQVSTAESADVNLATHARAAWKGLASLCDGRSLVSIHENAVNILRPTEHCNEGDIQAARGVLDRPLNDPKSLDWFGDATREDGDGNVIHDKQQEQRREALLEFTNLVADVADSLSEVLVSAKRNAEFQPKRTMSAPGGAEWLLF